ncbi:MAG: adenine deaminase [Desulfovibrionaceae bacterium]
MDTQIRKELVEASLGKIPCTLCIKNVNVVNVYTKEILPARVFIYKEYIVDVEYSEHTALAYADQEFDGEGKYLSPGLIDSHLHIESSMLTPYNFAEAVIPHGTTTVIADPHEIGNVFGVEGVQYMLDASENIPMEQFFLAPSCVPSVEGMENTGASFSAKEVDDLLGRDRILGIGEIMDYVGVMNNNERMVKIIEAGVKRGMFLQGHAPQLRGSELSAYLCGGPVSCHETREGEEALEKLRKGMIVDARESSISKDLVQILSGLQDINNPPVNLVFCTDDREPEDIRKYGHLNYSLKIAVEQGMPAVAAISCATLHTAIEYSFSDRGAIAPGKVADLVLFDNLISFCARAVWFRGTLTAKDGIITKAIVKPTLAFEKHNSVEIKMLSKRDLEIKAPIQNGTVNINLMSYDTPTGCVSYLKECVPVYVKDGIISLEDHDRYAFAAVINRYPNNNNISVAVVENFHINEGAIGGTVSHDSHNVTIVYRNVEDALLVVNRIREMHGGVACAKQGNIVGELALPVAGLISLLSAADLEKAIEKLNTTLREDFAMESHSPLMRVSTLALPVIPYVKMSDMGLIDVVQQKFIDVICS